MVFANDYWSADYATGIDLITTQLLLLILQLHDLRRLVGAIVSHNAHNECSLMTLLQGSFSLFHTVVKPLAMDTEKKSDDDNSHSALEDSDAENFDIVRGNHAPLSIALSLSECLSSINSQSKCCADLARLIEREVLSHINETIKCYEPSTRLILNQLQTLLNEYEQSCNLLDDLKIRFKDCVQTQGIVVLPSRDTEALHSDSASDEEDGASIPAYESEKTSLESAFSFPVEFGPLKMQNMRSLSGFLKRLVDETPVSSRRKIPIPGRSLDLFSSDDLCKVLAKDIGPARASLERIGQALLTHDLAVNSALFAAKSFRSHGMLLEWLDKAIRIAEMNHEAPPSLHSDRSDKTDTSSRSGRRNDNVAIATRSFQEMFLSVKQQFAKKTVCDQLDEVEIEYNETHRRLMGLRRKLESTIRSSVIKMEQLERVKIEMVHKSLAKLLELVYNSSLESTRALHASALRHINTINNPENYASDLDAIHSHFATGIFWPQQNASQNIRHLFDLYKDYLLQPKVSTLANGPELQSVALIPQFLYGIITAIASRQEPNASIFDAWCAPLDHNAFWKVKELVAERVAALNVDADVNDEAAAHAFYIEVCIDEVTKHDTPIVINFLRGWFLETHDSVIPGLVFDQATLAPEGSSGRAQLAKCLASVPRSNLASLIYVLEHVCGAAELACMPSYEICDDIVELDARTDEETVTEIAKRLNDVSAVGSVPFMHLLIRPPVLKNAAGFHPPLDKYLILSEHLLNVELRQQLLTELLENERKSIAKRENEKMGVKRDLKPPSLPQRAQSPQPLDNFSLRPFHKRVLGVPTTLPDRPDRTRPLSAVLPTSIEVEYEGKTKSLA